MNLHLHRERLADFRAADGDGPTTLRSGVKTAAGKTVVGKTAVETPMGKATVVEAMMEPVVVEMMKAIGEEDRSTDKERWPIEPGVPIVRVGVRIDIDRLRRQCVDLLRRTGRILRDPPSAIRLLAGLPDSLLRLSSDHHLSGELTAILRIALRCGLGHLCWGGS